MRVQMRRVASQGARLLAILVGEYLTLLKTTLCAV